jgi:ABC-type phosphate/phosphonate transport system substrate-binding protein
VIAHLLMYDVSKNYQAHQRLWQAFRDLMPNAPALTRHSDNLLSDWLNPELFFSQTCGLPFRASLRRHVKLIATPNNNIENCAPGFYHSVILARKGSAPDLIKNDFVLAYNEPQSQSGWAAPQSIGISGKSQLCTGGHAASALALTKGIADIAAIDALTWRFLCRDWDKASQLEVVTTTPPTPSLPYITALKNDAKTLYQNLKKAILGIDKKDQETLQIFGLVNIAEQDYMEYPLPIAPLS